MSNSLSLENLAVSEKRVLVRVDYNVPFDSEGRISNDTRIRASLPTIQWLLDQGAAVILMSHLGRPKGKRDPSFSLKPCAERLAELISAPVQMATDCVGSEIEALAQGLKPGSVMLLENLRFHEAETKPEADPNFARSLANLADIYVNDAFGAAHRAHSSTYYAAQHFDQRAAGYLLLKEIECLGSMLASPKRPYWAIVGGAKVSTKLGVLKSLQSKTDGIMVGGAMMFTLLKAQGKEIGDSLFEADWVDEMTQFIESCAQQKMELLLPEDVVIAQKVAADAEHRVVHIDEGIPSGWMGLDIGPATLKKWTKLLDEAGTVLWNGPVGVFEIEPFAHGTLGLAKQLARGSALSIVGGGDSVAAVYAAGVQGDMTHLSTGGGASLEFIEHGTLPAIEVLKQPIARF